MDDKELFDQFLQGSNNTSTGNSTVDAASSLCPENGSVEQPIMTNTPEKPDFLNMDIDAILDEYRKQTIDEEVITDDRLVMQEMITTMRELTDEVKRLRAQIKPDMYNASTYPRERPPGFLDDVAQTDVSSLNTHLYNAPEDYYTGREAEDIGESDTEATLNIPDKSEEQMDNATDENKKKNKVLSVISSVLFYTVIVAIVFGAFLIKSNSGGRPTMIAGYSAFTVLTSSMEDVYPKGSLIITKSTDAEELNVGDDITYMISETSSITHRIIGITENFQGTGERAFETQGVMNPNPDKELVAASNVVGKVVFHSKTLGDMAAFVSKNWPFLLFLLIVLIGLITFLKWNVKKSDSDKEDKTSDSDKQDEQEKSTDKKLKLHFKKQKDLPERRNENIDNQ